MKQIFNAAVICLIALSACTTPFKKAKDGSEYKIISIKKGPKVLTGNFIEMSTIAKYNDSVLASSIDDAMPQYAQYDTSKFPSPFKEVFKTIHVGDSLVIRMSTDSIIAKGQAPPFMKKGQWIYQYFTITNVFTTQEQTDSAQKKHIPAAKAKAYKKQQELVEKQLAENKDQIAKDSKVIDEYLAKNSIKATKTKWGTYIAIQNEGSGDKITSDAVVSVNYTGKTLDSGYVFDSNTDPKFKHVQPYDVNMSQLSGLILGWFDAIAQMKKGTKATIYIPSTLAYGKNGRMPEIKPDKILVFDMEVVNVTSEEAMMEQQAAMQQKAQEAQQQMMDSIQKAQGKK